ncbi:MAG: RNA polymerase sigma factor [Oscillospiraceae bacterium]|nr:RNA polymerase sigma factor [Oscillospiraceae bacterium]
MGNTKKLKNGVAEAVITEVYERTLPSVYRLCYSYLKNSHDTQDMVQSVYVKLLQSGRDFESDEHQKAWLLLTARNLCKNNLRHWWRRNEPLERCDSLPIASPAEDYSGVRDVVLGLPDKYKILVFLYYYEGYDTNEIADMLKKNNSTVRRHLAEARAILGGIIREEE